MTNKGLIPSALGGTDVYLMTVNCGENSDEQLPGRRLWGGVGLLQGRGHMPGRRASPQASGSPKPFSEHRLGSRTTGGQSCDALSHGACGPWTNLKSPVSVHGCPRPPAHSPAAS